MVFFGPKVHAVVYHSPVLLFFFGFYMKLNYLRRWYYSKHIFVISEQAIFVLLIYERIEIIKSPRILQYIVLPYPYYNKSSTFFLIFRQNDNALQNNFVDKFIGTILLMTYQSILLSSSPP
jgi:hypothetical protein